MRYHRQTTNGKCADDKGTTVVLSRRKMWRSRNPSMAGHASEEPSVLCPTATYQMHRASDIKAYSSQSQYGSILSTTVRSSVQIL
jgi:hypothetical protein